jgi:hypothetical protein
MSVTEISPDWQTLQGTTVEGGYELKDILGAAGDHAVLRVRVLGDYTLKATAAFYVLEEALADEQISIWQSIRFFDSKGAVAVPLGAGKLNLNGTALAYVVYQSADETLGDAVQSRALTLEEGLDATRAIARGLGELHANGYVHGYLSPPEVRAVGDRVEVSTDFIRRVNTEPIVEQKQARYLAPESSARNVTIAADIWCLGATIFESLTRKAYEPALHADAAGLQHPFGTLLEGCLEPDPERRLKLTDFEAILRSKAAPPKPKAVEVPAAEPAKAAAATVHRMPDLQAAGEGADRPEPLKEESKKEPEAPAAAVVDSARAEKAPPRASIGTGQSGKRAEEPLPYGIAARREFRNEANVGEPATSSAARRGWMYAIAAFIVIFAILWFVHARGRQTASPPANNTALPQTAATKQPGSAWPTKTLSPDSKTQNTTSEPGAVVPPGPEPAVKPQARGRSFWRVVLYTYRRQPDAEKRAQEISAKKPDLHPEVFAVAPSGPFLVVAGGRMTREAAAQMRLRAVREGMPHDSYIQNYDH